MKQLALVFLGMTALVATSHCGGGQTQSPSPSPPVADAENAQAPGAARAAEAPDHGQPEGGEIDPALREIAEGLLAMLQEMTQAAQSHQDNCDAMADSMQAVMDKNRGLLDGAKQFENDEKAQAWFERTYQDRIRALIPPLQSAVTPCMENPKLQQVLDSSS